MYFQDLCEDLKEKIIEIVKEDLRENGQPTDNETVDDYINRNNTTMQIAEWLSYLE